MSFNLLFLPLLGGYIFARNCFRTRYSALRSENYRLLFVAAECGLYLLILAAILRYIFTLAEQSLPLLAFADRLWHAVFPFEYSGVAVLSFILGRTLWPVVNRLFDFTSEGEVNRTIDEKGDPLEVLLKHAMEEHRAVIVTLQSGKVYVGQVITNFNPAYDVQSVKISTILSGYRKPEDQTVIFNTDYGSVLKAVHAKDPSVSERDMKDLGTVFPLTEIRSVGIFSLPMYKQFFAHLTNRPPLQDHP